MATQLPSASPFLNGWRRLPDELKIHILKYALPADQNFGDRASFRRGKDIRGIPLMVGFYKFVLPLLIAFPESAGLISEVFYSTTSWSSVTNALLKSPNFVIHRRRSPIGFGVYRSI
jgi:hypothetical protein